MKSVFLSWSEPACRLIAKRLLDSGSSHSCLVLVPTKEASRQLRQEIALASTGKAALSPRILPAGSFLDQADDGTVASPLLELQTWFKVLETTGEDECKALFPQGLKKDTAFLLDVAEQMASLRNKIAREGVSFSDIAQKSSEQERWNDLDELNRRFAGTINACLKKDSASALWQEAANPRLAAGMKDMPNAKIILACIPELSRPLRRSLSAAEEMGIPVEIWIHAPSELGDQFDGWGSPLPQFWNTCRIGMEENNVFMCGNPSLLARTVSSKIAEKAAQEAVALGVCDPRMTTPIEIELAVHGWGIYKPSGKPFSGTGLMHVLRLLEASLTRPNLAEPLANLLRSPILAEALGITQHYNICSKLDRIWETWLPESSEYMQSILDSREIEREKKSGNANPEYLARVENENKALSRAWKAVIRWRDSFKKSGTLGKKLEEWLIQIPGSDQRENNACEVLLQAVEELSSLEETSKTRLSPSDSLGILIRHLQQSNINRRRTEADTLDAQGWLELPFCPEPHLIITGLTEGTVPEISYNDQFIPESLRSELNLNSARDKTARDSFLLASLIESRKSSGSVTIALSKTTPQHDPLVPSSLLMRCSDEELPSRVRLLFGKQSSESAPTPYSRGNWHMEPSTGWGPRTGNIHDLIPGFSNPWGEGGKAFSPSTLKKFLACPLRFWIQTALRLNDSDAIHRDRRNMLPNEAGTLIHKVLETFAKQYSVFHHGLDEQTLKKDISHILDDEFGAMFGRETLLPLLMQKASIEQRLAAYASLHFSDLREGWECVEFERQVTDWRLGGFPMNFRIDRIDRHADGRIRVIDYKTGKAESCEKKHLRILSEAGCSALSSFSPSIQPCPSLFNRKYRPHRWIDLQLPIYVLWAGEHFGSQASASYYALPSNKREIRRFDWENMHELPEEGGQPVIESAKTWACAAMDLLKQGRCTLSSEELEWGDPPYDLFSDLKVEESIQQIFGIS